MAVIASVMVGTVLVITLLSCLSDIRSLSIPNAYSLAILLCFVPAWIAMPSVFAPLWQHVAAFFIVFIVTYAMFYKGMMGGGDVKLATALSLWIGLRGMIPFIFSMSIVGGVLGVLTLIIRKKKPFRHPRPGGWIGEVQAGRDAIPYGVAISFGAWVVFFHTVLTLH